MNPKSDPNPSSDPHPDPSLDSYPYPNLTPDPYVDSNPSPDPYSKMNRKSIPGLTPKLGSNVESRITRDEHVFEGKHSDGGIDERKEKKEENRREIRDERDEDRLDENLGRTTSLLSQSPTSLSSSSLSTLSLSLPSLLWPVVVDGILVIVICPTVNQSKGHKDSGDRSDENKKMAVLSKPKPKTEVILFWPKLMVDLNGSINPTSICLMTTRH